MDKKRLSRKTAMYTSRSGTTTMVNYDERHHILEVEFIEGDVYQYLKVPIDVWEKLKDEIQTGGSSGTFINKEIKPHYKFIKI